MYPTNAIDPSSYPRPGNGGLSGASSTTPQPIGRVASSLMSTDKLTTELFAIVQQLEAQLTGIMRPAGPTGESKGGRDATRLPSPLADDIDALNERLHGVLTYMQNISARIDL